MKNDKYLPLSHLTFRRAVESDRHVVSAILEELRQWLCSRGIDQWREGFSEKFVLADITRNHVPLACIGGEIAGLCSLQEEELAWETFDGKALYLHRLAVRRAYAGIGLGAAIMRHAEKLARQAGKEYLRLDCWAGNESLKKYYLGLGYAYRGDWREKTWMVSLFEKRITLQK